EEAGHRDGRGEFEGFAVQGNDHGRSEIPVHFTARRMMASMEHLLASYERIRARSRALFGLLSEEAYYSQPIALRHPLVFYDGHLPSFSFNTLVKKALGGPG